MSDLIVSRDWLTDHVDEGDVRVVDVRDAWEYEGIGHLPDAVNVPFDEFRSTDGETGMLPGADRFAALLGDVGVAPTDTVVAYDDHHGVFAARFVVTALCYDHAEVALLDGDYSAWSRERPTTTDTPSIDPVEYPPGELREDLLVDAAGVRAAIDSDAVLVDTREPQEFAEGHLPGAVNLDWKTLVDDDTRGLRPRTELESVLEAHGVTPDRRVVLYCNTARRISHTYLVLRHLGYEDVGFYEGSLTEWHELDGAVERTTTE